MPAKRNILILQVMENRLRFLAGRSSFWRFELADIADLPLDPRVEEGKDLASYLFKEIERFSLRNNLKNPLVIIALSRGLLVWRYFKVPPVPSENLDSLIGFEIEKHLPVKAEEIYYRCLPVERTREGWTILLAGTRKDFIRRLEEALEMMGLKAAAVVPDLWGLVGLLRRRGGDLDSGHPVVVHLEGRSMDAAVFGEGRPLFYRRYQLPAEAEEISSDEAGRMSLYAEEAAGVIETAVREAAESLGLTGRLERGYLCVEGAGADLVIRGLGRSSVRSWQAVRPSEISFLRGRAGLERYPRLLPAAGLALGPGEARTCPINLISPPAARRPRRGNLRVTAVLAVILAVSACFFFGSVDVERRRRLAFLDREIAQQKGQVEEIKILGDSLKRDEERIKTLERIVSDRVRVVDILKELTRVIPNSAYLSQMIMKNGTVELLGFADSASDLIPRLEDSPLFKNVAFDAPITSQAQQKERFKIKMVLE